MAPTASGDDYLWIGSTTGSWDDAANWEDVTTGEPATAPPGANDSATIAATAGETLTISGTGSAATLALQGAIAIDAALTIGTLTNPATDGGSPQITLDTGSVVDAGTATLNDVSLALGAGLNVTGALTIGTLAAEGTVTAGSATLLNLTAYEADLSIAGALTLGDASSTGRYNFVIDDGTTIQAGSLDFDGLISIDGISALEVGTQGGAADGVITIDAGHVATFGGAALNVISPNVVDNGTLILAPGSMTLSPISGTGTVEVEQGTNPTALTVAAGRVTVQVDKGTSVAIGSVAAGNTVVLAGDDALFGGNTGYSPTAQGVISGFDDTDAIIYADASQAQLSSDGATYTLLTIANTTYTLLGIYAGDPLLSIPIESGTATEVLLGMPAVTTISPGSATGEQYVWAGALDGNWNDASNWQDVTTGANPALVAPGSLDNVTVASPASSYKVISGSGDAASLAFTGGPAAVTGKFNVGTLTGDFVLYNGTITADSASLGNVAVRGDSVLNVTGVLNAGTMSILRDSGLSFVTAGSAKMSALSVENGTKVTIAGLLDLGNSELTSETTSVTQAGALMVGGISVSYGSVEVGNANDATKGAVTVDPGATLTFESGGQSGGVYGNLIDNGLINVMSGADLDIVGAASGTGTVILGGNAVLNFGTTFSTGITVSLQGTGNAIQMAVDHSYAIRTTGFAAGDSILFYYSGNYFPGQPGYTITGTDLSVEGDHFYLSNAQPGLTFVGTAEDGGTLYRLTAEGPCFCPGTLIQTDRGPIPVEHLVIGDQVITLDGEAEPIRWIGQRSFAGSFIAGNAAILPVCIKAGALADGVPSQDLWVSPGHALFVDGQLVPAARLVNGVSIVQAEAVESVTYYHVELPHHAVLSANGAPAESFLDDDCRNQFQNAASFYATYPDAEPMAEYAPRLEDGFALQSIQDRLALRAGVFPSAEPIGVLRGFVDQVGLGRITGWAQDCDSPEEPVALEIVVGTTPVLCVLANAYRADLRQGGMGSGCHAFDVTLDFALEGPVTVRRVADGAVLPFTASAVAALAA